MFSLFTTTSPTQQSAFQTHSNRSSRVPGSSLGCSSLFYSQLQLRLGSFIFLFGVWPGLMDGLGGSLQFTVAELMFNQIILWFWGLILLLCTLMFELDSNASRDSWLVGFVQVLLWHLRQSIIPDFLCCIQTLYQNLRQIKNCIFRVSVCMQM